MPPPPRYVSWVPVSEEESDCRWAMAARRVAVFAAGLPPLAEWRRLKRVEWS